MQKELLEGIPDEHFTFLYENLMGEVHPHTTAFEGIIPILKHRLKDAMSESQRLDYESFMTAIECHTCHGARLRPEVLGITVGGRNINEVCQMPVRECLKFLKSFPSATVTLSLQRKSLRKFGPAFLSLTMSVSITSPLAGQRLLFPAARPSGSAFATQIGSGLVGVLYILDEPSIGLHQRDNDKLLSTLKHLRDLGKHPPCCRT